MTTHFRFAIIISYILLSSSGCSDSDPVAVISNTDLSFSKFGYSGGIADVDADGSEEIAVGAPDAEGKGALLFYSATGELKYSIESPKEGYNFASAFTALPDVNGDGTNDFAVGAMHANGMSPLSGAVFVYNGSSPPTLLWTLKGEIPLDKFSYPKQFLAIFRTPYQMIFTGINRMACSSKSHAIYLNTQSPRRIRETSSPPYNPLGNDKIHPRVKTRGILLCSR